MLKTQTNNRFRRRLARAVAGLALAVPGAAIAASPAEEQRQATGDAPAVALISGFGFGLAADPVAPSPVHPVDGAVDYGSPEASFGNERGRPHEGQDIFAPAGTRLVSPLPTTVLETGTDSGRGNWAALYDSSADRTYVYFHMIEPAAVQAGKKLAPGDRVGAVGCTGSCYGDHLHFEVRAGRDPYGAASDPLPLLQRWERTSQP